MSLADQIIEHGPYRDGAIPAEVAHGTNDADDLNELRDELIAARATPDVDHARGAAEALATLRRSIDTYPGSTISRAIVLKLLDLAAAELGITVVRPGEPVSPP